MSETGNHRLQLVIIPQQDVLGVDIPVGDAPFV